MSKVYTENQKRVKELFCKERGAWKWNETWETILDLNEHILEAYSTLSSLPHKRGRISEKVIGMIYVAIDGACTHMHIPGMRNHMKHGLEALDITPEEFLEVLAISSLLGVATYTEGFPVLVEEFKKAGLAAGGELEEKQIALKDRFIAEHQYWNDNLELGLAIDPEMFECYADYLKAAFAKKPWIQRPGKLFSLPAMQLLPQSIKGTLDVISAERWRWVSPKKRLWKYLLLYAARGFIPLRLAFLH